MFRCITKLKGLIIDVDSFKEDEINAFNEINEKYQCLFMTTNHETSIGLHGMYMGCEIFEIKKFIKMFSPSQYTHKECLDKLKLKSTEVAYVSRDIGFIENAMGFMSGTIWLTDFVNYLDASKSPDLVCRSIPSLMHCLDVNVQGFLGEVALFPNLKAKGMIVPVKFEINKETVPLFMLGRYFGYSHYMNQLHPYSSAIYLNKKEGKAYGKFNPIFERLISKVVKNIIDDNRVDGICSVPSRPGKENRFKDILKCISEEHGIIDLSDEMTCVKAYQTQKGLSQTEREENVSDVFSYNGSLVGKNIILIDDIVSTGATIRECAKELKRKGVNEIYIIVLAVNQIQGNYWSSEQPQITCPACDDKMHLLVNSHNRNFFYSCYNCRNKTFSFEEGWKALCDYIDNEFNDQN